jgi:hypothetical protein
VIDKEGNETDKAVAWEKAFIQLVKVCSLFQSSDCVYGAWKHTCISIFYKHVYPNCVSWLLIFVDTNIRRERNKITLKDLICLSNRPPSLVARILLLRVQI